MIYYKLGAIEVLLSFGKYLQIEIVMQHLQVPSIHMQDKLVKKLFPDSAFTLESSWQKRLFTYLQQYSKTFPPLFASFSQQMRNKSNCKLILVPSSFMSELNYSFQNECQNQLALCFTGTVLLTLMVSDPFISTHRTLVSPDKLPSVNSTSHKVVRFRWNSRKLAPNHLYRLASDKGQW